MMSARLPRRLTALVPLLIAATFGCGGEATESIAHHLDRPTAIAFGCARVDAAAADGGVITAAPPSACADLGAHEPSEPGLPQMFGFALNSVRGEIAVFRALEGEIIDAEPRQPGFSFIPVGALAEDLEITEDGRDLFVSVGSTCELVRVPVAQAAQVGSGTEPLGLEGRQTQTAAGALNARPSDIAIMNEDACQMASSGATRRCAWVSYPGCGLVALVALDTRQVLRSLSISAAGVASQGANPVCSAECPSSAAGAGVGNDGGVVPGSPASPHKLALVEFGGGRRRIYVGLSNDSAVWGIELLSDGTPDVARTRRIALEDARGVLALKASPPLAVQGAQARFLYVVARDGTVRVLSIDASSEVECDTQIDPRTFSSAQTSDARLCTPVGTGARRRASATSPGIRLPFGDLARDVEFATVDNLTPQQLSVAAGNVRVAWSPVRLSGEFAFIAGARGRVYAVNIFDRDAVLLHPDDIGATRAHALRSGVLGQYDSEAIASFRSQGVPRTTLLARTAGGLEVPTTQGGPDLRKVRQPDLTGATFQSVPHPAQRLPVLNALTVAEIEAERRATFPDLHELSSSDRFVFAWEGSLTAGVPRFSGNVMNPTDGATGILADSATPFCSIGAQPGDILVLRGCDQDTDCGPAATCTTNPAAPTGLAGLCFSGDEEARKLKSGECTEFLISGRQYRVAKAQAGTLTLNTFGEPHPDSLTCVNDGECPAVRDLATGLDRLYRCETDASPNGLRHCVARCAAAGECGVGFICDVGRQQCIAGPIPRPACFPELQRYELKVGDALYASRPGAIAPHRLSPDAANGDLCVPDPNKTPLLQNRVPRNPLPCAPGVEGPCTTVVDGMAVVRFENPAIRFDFINMQGPIPRGFVLDAEIGGGFGPTALDMDSPLPYAMRRAPDGMIYVVQSGDNTASGGRGVIQRFQPVNVARDRSFIIR